MTTVFEHLEEFAGEIVDGWKIGSDGTERPFQVVRTKGGPHAGTVTFSTLGLSRFQLPSGPERDHKHIRHELILVVPEDAIPFNVISLLQQVGMEAIEREQAYLRGEVIGPRGPMFEGCQPKALYVAIPVYFPNEFAVATTEESGKWCSPGSFLSWTTSTTCITPRGGQRSRTSSSRKIPIWSTIAGPFDACR